ncbi:uncharacterized protein LOC119110385 [Pollicipes pollicipes]|uniref:uncharacterized protein LOC119110385 n=1 Tax=Pollicipes pollicipes TaxID=41117 RepID=UPI001884C2ED|nr:uncharacterized protein LOC119110385 [Pollicipes pollicipes]
MCSRSRAQLRCGGRVSRLRLSEYTTAAGACGVLAVLVTALMCVMSPMVLAMRVTRRRVVVKFRHAIMGKLVISCIGTACCVLCIVLFDIEVRARRLGENLGFFVYYSWSFYIMVSTH